MSHDRLPDIARPSTHRIHEVVLGADSQTGGTRERVVRIGGQTTMPFHSMDGAVPHRPALAMEITSRAPSDWPQPLVEPVRDVCSDPGSWAKRCVADFGAEAICLRLTRDDSDPARAAQAVSEILSSVGVPLIVWGTGDNELDAQLFPQVAEAAASEQCLLGTITETNYRTLTALATAYGHLVIAESPVDINMAKQINILAADAGFPQERLVMYPTTGALGYGIEYVVSIMERLRLAGLKGDRNVAMPIVADIGREAWSVKEAKADANEEPGWGDPSRRAPAWEAATAMMYVHAGTDLLIMRHPEAVRATAAAIDRLMPES